MKREPIASYLRSHRRRSGLSQRDLAEILGSVGEIQVSRHERSVAVAGLLTVLGYEAIFGVPISGLFPGLYETVAAGIEERLSKMEDELKRSSGKGRGAASTAHQIEWLSERKNPQSI